MKAIFFILLIGISILAGCGSQEFGSDDPDNPDTPISSVEFNLKNKEKIRLWCNTVFSFEATEEGEYMIESEDTSVVKVRVDGQRFTVRTVAPGETDLILYGSTGQKSVIRCESRAFADLWAESIDLGRIYQNTAMVAATDKTVAEAIRKEIEPLSRNRDHKYFFEGTDKLTVWRIGGAVQGTYLWELETGTLTLNYAGRTERYYCDLMPKYPNIFMTPRPGFILAVQQDLTEEYASKYPEAGIKDVYIIRHIVSVGDWWITEKEE